MLQSFCLLFFSDSFCFMAKKPFIQAKAFPPLMDLEKRKPPAGQQAVLRIGIWILPIQDVNVFPYPNDFIYWYMIPLRQCFFANALDNLVDAVSQILHNRGMAQNRYIYRIIKSAIPNRKPFLNAEIPAIGICICGFDDFRDAHRVGINIGSRAFCCSLRTLFQNQPLLIGMPLYPICQTEKGTV